MQEGWEGGEKEVHRKKLIYGCRSLTRTLYKYQIALSSIYEVKLNRDF